MASLRSRVSFVARASGLVTFGALAWVFCFADGCTDTRCDGSSIVYGLSENEGAVVGPTSWESSSFEGRWLDFSHERLITFKLQQQVGSRRIVAITPYIAPSEEPSKNGGYFTIASGNLAVIHVEEPGWFTVRNDTCADYFVRVLVELEPEPPTSSGVGDGGVSEPDAAPSPDAADSASDGP